MKLDTKASDWCTMWPDSWLGYDYSACCYQHDIEYEDPDIGRWDADVNLLQCVAKQGKTNFKGRLMAVVMFIGVRSAGWLFKHYVAQVKQ